jgi:hypothetical protein
MYGNAYNPAGSPVPPTPFQQPQSLFRFGETSLWSTQLIAGGTALANQNFRLFTTPIGQVGQGFGGALTISETSLKEGGRVPAGVAYDVFGVSAQILGSGTDAGVALDLPIDSAARIQNLVNVQNNGVLQWSFIQTDIDICPVYLAGSGGGTGGAVSQNAAGANSGNLNNGFGSVWMYRKHPVQLPGAQTFAIRLSFGGGAGVTNNLAAGAGALAIRVVLLGYYKNVIEIG